MTTSEKAKAYDKALEKMKEIITMDNNPTIPKEIGEYLFPELVEPEDERMWKRVFEMFSHYSTMCPGNIDEIERVMHWLKKQGEQQPAEWSEKDEKMLESIEGDILNADMVIGGLETAKLKIDWLESLRPQKQREWTDEDTTMAHTIISDGVRGVGLDKKQIDWLESLNEILRPQKQWKPSEEQMVVLELASKYERVFTPKQIDILIGLKEQLKKL